jgi:uncharacterized protein YwgA
MFGGKLMAMQFTERWNQYGIIAELASKLEGVSPQFGKTVLQKLVFILQEVYKVPCDYEYTLYNYGPYSNELAGDLSFFASLDGVKVEWNQGLGYKILPAPKTDHFRQKVRAFLDKYKNSIDEVINKFGRMSARELELCSTIIYVFNQSLTGKDDLIFRVKEIKPHFSINEINDAVKQLIEYKIINPPTS